MHIVGFKLFFHEMILLSIHNSELSDLFQIATHCSLVKVFPYTFVRRGMPVREDTYPEPSACEVGWPVPFLAAFFSPVLPPGTHLLLGEQ